MPLERDQSRHELPSSYTESVGDATGRPSRPRNGVVAGVEGVRPAGRDEQIAHEVSHRLRSEDHRVVAGRDPLAADGSDGAQGRLDARLVGEMVEPGAQGARRTLGAARLDHGRGRGGELGRLVGLDVGQGGGDDGHALLEDAHVPAEDEPEAGQGFLAPRDLGRAAAT